MVAVLRQCQAGCGLTVAPGDVYCEECRDGVDRTDVIDRMDGVDRRL